MKPQSRRVARKHNASRLKICFRKAAAQGLAHAPKTGKRGSTTHPRGRVVTMERLFVRTGRSWQDKKPTCFVSSNLDVGKAKRQLDDIEKITVLARCIVDLLAGNA